MSFFKDHVVGIFVLSVAAGIVSSYLYEHFSVKEAFVPTTGPSETQPPTKGSGQLSRQVQSPDQRQAQPPAAMSKPSLPEPVLPSLPTAPEANQNTQKSPQQPYATPARTASSLLTLDGQWFSTRFRYGFKIKGDIGVATQSNSPKFAPGDVILRFERLSETEFHGKQIFTDGGWNEVSGRLVDANTLTMTGGGHVWTMSRQ